MDQQRSGPSGAAGGLSRAAGHVATACLGLMVALGLLNTGLRWLGKQLGENLAGNAGLEGQWYLFSLAFLLAAAPTLARGEHVRVDVLSGRLSPKARAWVDLVGGLALLLPFCAFAAWSTGEMAARSALIFEGSPDPGGLPRWPIKLLIPFAFGLLGLQGLAEVRAAFARARARA